MQRARLGRRSSSARQVHIGTEEYDPSFPRSHFHPEMYRQYLARPTPQSGEPLHVGDAALMCVGCAQYHVPSPRRTQCESMGHQSATVKAYSPNCSTEE